MPKSRKIDLVEAEGEVAVEVEDAGMELMLEEVEVVVVAMEMRARNGTEKIT